MKIVKELFVGKEEDILAWYVDVPSGYVYPDGSIHESTQIDNDGESYNIADYGGWYTTLDAARQAAINYYFRG